MFYVTNDKEVVLQLGLDVKTPSLVVLKKQAKKKVTFDEVFPVVGERLRKEVLGRLNEVSTSEGKNPKRGDKAHRVAAYGIGGGEVCA